MYLPIWPIWYYLIAPISFMRIDIYISEITKVRGSLFHFGNQKEGLALPEANGQIVTLQEKLFVPCKEHPEVIKN